LRGSGNQLRPGDIITSTQTIFVYAVQADCSDESSFNVTIDPSFCKEPEEEVNVEFPLFFTPNGDGINDFWQFVTPLSNLQINIETISIYNRYGNLIQQINSNSIGWDGNYNGVPLPSSDYWFKANLVDGRIFKGHFALKR
jgi:gliding motility-associated-like protein